MARTPKPPKLKHDGLNFGQKAMISVFIFAFFYRWGFTDFTLWDAVKMPFGFAMAWVLVTPEWRRLLFSPEKWFKPSEWAQKEPFQSIQEFRNRRNLSYEEKYKLEYKIENLLHFSMIVPLLLMFGYFAFRPILNLAASFGVPSWGGFIIFIIVCWCVFALLANDAISNRFSDMAGRIVFKDDEEVISKAPSTPASPRSIEDPEQTDEFAYDPTAFANDGSERSSRVEKAADLAVLLGGEAEAPKEKGKAPEHHPDDLALWEVVSDPASTAEERKTALDMILEREAERKNG